MSSYAIVQALVLTLVIGGSVAYAFRQYFPKSLRQRLGAWLQRPQHAQWLRAAGAWLTPVSGKAGCASGCSSCGGCSTKVAVKNEQPLIFATQRSQQEHRTGLQ